MMTVGRLKQGASEFNIPDDTEIKIAIFDVMSMKFDLFQCSSATHAGDLVLFDDWEHNKNEPVVRPVKVLDK